MGITGLLPFVKKASREINLQDFRGITVAVDIYCWLHKGAFSCADKLALGENTDGYIIYCMKYIDMLLSKNIKPILVFDGCRLPAKAVTETKRRENRSKYKNKARDLLREGKYNEARDCFQKCVDITPEMAKRLLEACKLRNVDCIVAPYEADAQLAFFSVNHHVDLVITEDSDLLLFGAERILFKLDLAGRGILVERDKLAVCMNSRAFSFDKFLCMCILSGCDYLPSLPGIGLGKAQKFFDKTTNPDLYTVLTKIPSYLNMPSLIVTEEYRQKFMQAYYTFHYQLIFNPFTSNIEPLKKYPPELKEVDMSFAGKLLEKEIALGIAKGDVNVSDLSYWPAGKFDLKLKYSVTNHSSIWDVNYRPHKQNMRPKEPERSLTQNKAMIISVPKFITDMKKHNASKELGGTVMSEVKEEDIAIIGMELQNNYQDEPPIKKQRIDDNVDLALELSQSESPIKSENNTTLFLTSLQSTRSNEDSDLGDATHKNLSVNPFASSEKKSPTVIPVTNKFSALKKFSSLRRSDLFEAERSRYFSTSLSQKEDETGQAHKLQTDVNKTNKKVLIKMNSVNVSGNLFHWKGTMTRSSDQINTNKTIESRTEQFTCIKDPLEAKAETKNDIPDCGQSSDVEVAVYDSVKDQSIEARNDASSTQYLTSKASKVKDKTEDKKKQLSLKQLFSFSKKSINVFPRK